MMHPLESSSTDMNLDFIGKIFEKLRGPLGLFLLLVLTSILQHVFDLHFVCSCRPGLHANDVLFIILPSLILTLAVYVVKIFYEKRFFLTVEFCICQRCCNDGNDGCCIKGCGWFWGFFFLKRFYEYFRLTALWTAMVLFDGDWYFCLKTNFNSTQTGLPCKEKFTYEEERIKDSYKTESLDWGLGLCCGLLFIWSLVEKFRTQIRSRCWCSRPYYEAKYKKILSEELSSFIEKQLKEIAVVKAEEMCKPEIERIRNPGLSENNRRENEVSQNNVGEKDISQIWKGISDPRFIIEKEKRASETLGRTQDGQGGQNLETAQDPASSSSSSCRSCGGGDEGHDGSTSGGAAAAAEGSVGEGQRGQPRTASA